MVLVGHVIRELIVGCEIHNFLRNMDCSSAVYSHNRICYLILEPISPIDLHDWSMDFEKTWFDACRMLSRYM